MQIDKYIEMAMRDGFDHLDLTGIDTSVPIKNYHLFLTFAGVSLMEYIDNLKFQIKIADLVSGNNGNGNNILVSMVSIYSKNDNFIKNAKITPELLEILKSRKICR